MAVADRIRNGQSLYEVDQGVVAQLAPTHILTQTLCDVCAPSTPPGTGNICAAPKLVNQVGPVQVAARFADREKDFHRSLAQG